MAWRSAARRVVEMLAERSGVMARREAAMRDGLTVVTYHRVLPDELAARHPLPQLVTPDSIFRAELKTIAERCEVVGLAEGVRALERGERAARPRVAITFDDGFADNAEVAGPILREAGMVATFFIVSGLTGTDGELWFEVAARRWRAASDTDRARAMRAAGAREGAGLSGFLRALKELPPRRRDAAIDELAEPGPAIGERPLDRAMTTAQLRGLIAAGHEIGGHSVTHPILTTLDEDGIRAEVAGCKRDLELRLARPVMSFCYPNGSYDERVVRATRDAGYEIGCTTKTGRNRTGADKLLLTRIDAAPDRVVGPGGYYDARAFRARLCLLREPAA